MEANRSKELLCFSNKSGSYGMELCYVSEICTQISVSKFPSLPEYYRGVCNYKGSIIPVVYMGEEKVRDEWSVTVIIQCGKYKLGIQLMREPYIETVTDSGRIDMPEGETDTDILKVKELYKTDDKLIAVIDMEKTMERLLVSKE